MEGYVEACCYLSASHSNTWEMLQQFVVWFLISVREKKKASPPGICFRLKLTLSLSARSGYKLRDKPEHFLQCGHRMPSEFKTEKEHANMLLGVSCLSTGTG